MCQSDGWNNIHNITNEERLRLIRSRVESNGWFYCDVVRDDMRFLIKMIDERFPDYISITKDIVENRRD